jgi:hypothetical protein
MQATSQASYVERVLPGMALSTQTLEYCKMQEVEVDKTNMLIRVAV